MSFYKIYSLFYSEIDCKFVSHLEKWKDEVACALYLHSRRYFQNIFEHSEGTLRKNYSIFSHKNIIQYSIIDYVLFDYDLIL